NDLARLHVDDIARRDVGEVSIETNRDPEGAGSCLDAFNLPGRHHRVVEDVDIVVHPVGEPEFGLIIGQGNAVARTAMRDSGARRSEPPLAPGKALDFY